MKTEKPVRGGESSSDGHQPLSRDCMRGSALDRGSGEGRAAGGGWEVPERREQALWLEGGGALGDLRACGVGGVQPGRGGTRAFSVFNHTRHWRSQ